MPPIGFIGALGVFRTGVAGIVLSLFAERRQMWRRRPLQEGAAGFGFVIWR